MGVGRKGRGLKFWSGGNRRKGKARPGGRLAGWPWVRSRGKLLAELQTRQNIAPVRVNVSVINRKFDCYPPKQTGCGEREQSPITTLSFASISAHNLCNCPFPRDVRQMPDKSPSHAFRESILAHVKVFQYGAQIHGDSFLLLKREAFLEISTFLGLQLVTPSTVEDS